MKSVKDKLIITAAVGFTAASTMVNPHFTNVLAEEIKDPAFVKEDASKTKTEKEKLEDSVKDAKSNLDEKKADVDAKKLDNRNQVKIKKISMIFHGFYCTLKIPEEKALFFRVV